MLFTVTDELQVNELVYCLFATNVAQAQVTLDCIHRPSGCALVRARPLRQKKPSGGGVNVSRVANRLPKPLVNDEEISRSAARPLPDGGVCLGHCSVPFWIAVLRIIRAGVCPLSVRELETKRPKTDRIKTQKPAYLLR
jgi:hypothetical protein